MQATSSTSAKFTASASNIKSTIPTTTTTTTTITTKHKTATSVTTAAALLNNNSAAAIDPNSEIEEISKKISEHADAIYRTWKSRGLAPAELLEFYTETTTSAGVGGDFFAATATKVVADDTANSTEGLQKLVNTFIIKDKEQRGVKSTATATATAAATTTITTIMKDKSSILKKAANADLTPSPVAAVTTGTNLTKSTVSKIGSNKNATTTTTATTIGLKSATQKPNTAILLKSQNANEKNLNAATTNVIRKNTKTEAATAATNVVASGSATKNNACVHNADQAQPNITPTSAATKNKTLHVNKKPDQQQQQPQPQKFSADAGEGVDEIGNKTRNMLLTATKQGKGAGLAANLDLNLDVNNLKELQTQNLCKIKELLQENENAATPAAATTITAAKVKKNLTPSPGKVESEKKTMAMSSISKPATTVPIAAMLTTTLTPSTRATSTATTSTTVTTTTATTATIATATTTLSAKAKDKIVNSSRQAPSYSAAAINQKTSSNVAGGKTSDSAHDDANVFNVVDNVAATANTITDKNSKISSSNKKSNTTTKLNNLQYLNEPLQTQQQPQKQQDQPNSISNNHLNKSTKTISKSVKTSANSSSSSGSKTTTAVAKDKNDKRDTKSATTATATTATNAGNSNSNHTMEVARSAMPTPTKMKSTRSLTNGQDKNIGRPILTRGSVAERVLMFEKCPDVRNLDIKRPTAADAPPKTMLKVKLHSTPPQASEQNSLQKEIRSTRSVYIPRFYFPHGKPQPTIALERTLRGILSAFDSFPNNQVTKDELPRILKLCGLPFYWRMPVMIFCQQGNSGLVERQRFVEFWKQMNVYCHEAASRFVYILSRGQRFRSYILPEDLAPLVQDVVDTHPGLAFLKEATEFHSRYVHTVIARIFYSVNRSWSGKISISELKKSDLMEIIQLLEEEDDINQIMAFFSYEHFYVIYCKFWELDKDHDLLINQEDLARHSDHALSTRIVERIFSGCVTRSDNKKDPDDEPKMSYTDFVWFLLSEEDKRTPTAIEYWFRCMDIDGDGALSMYELEYFYEEQQQRMESIGIETLPFEDCLCQMLDMIKPQRRDFVTLGDLKRCKMTHVFFDTFFNLEKYLDHEQRDPFASQRDEYSSDWDRFSAQEYELLISEENE